MYQVVSAIIIDAIIKRSFAYATSYAMDRHYTPCTTHVHRCQLTDHRSLFLMANKTGVTDIS